jgi:hypothetical protein
VKLLHLGDNLTNDGLIEPWDSELHQTSALLLGQDLCVQKVISKVLSVLVRVIRQFLGLSRETVIVQLVLFTQLRGVVPFTETLTAFRVNPLGIPAFGQDTVQGLEFRVLQVLDRLDELLLK